MRRILSLLAVASITFAFGSPLARANLVTNGDFNAVVLGSPFFTSNPADIPGWTHTGTVGDGLLWAVGYSDGGGSVTVGPPGDNQFVTMGGGFTATGTAGWTQTASGLTIGDQYLLQFYIADEGVPPLESPGTQTMTASVTSSGVTSNTYTVAGTGNYWKNWVQESFTFTAGATSAVLDFAVTNQQYDMGLGEVSLNPVSTAVLEPLLGGSVGLFLLTSRAKRWGRQAPPDPALRS